VNESEALSGLVGHIYDAAIDPGFWPDALRETARFVGGCSAAIYSKDPTSHSGGVLYDDGGLTLAYRELYFERYVQLDPATTRHFFTEIGELVATVDIMPYAEFEQSRFYREWVRPQQLVDFVSTVLDRSGTSASMFGVFRHERDGIVDEATRHRMHLVVPHVRRAALIGRALEQHSARRGAGEFTRHHPRRHVSDWRQRCAGPRQRRRSPIAGAGRAFASRRRSPRHQ
jgi:hypothetical protein